MRLHALVLFLGALAGGNLKLPYPTASPREVAQLPMADKSPSGFLFRGDSRPPRVIFEEGFHPFRCHYLLDTSKARFVSLTRRATSAIFYANGRHAGNKVLTTQGYVYVLSPEGMRDRTAYWLPDIDKANGWKFELAVDGSIQPGAIVGAYRFDNLGTGKPTVEEWIANPDYQYPKESPFTPKGRGCWARSCAGVKHLASVTCRGISCFRLKKARPTAGASPGQGDGKTNPGESPETKAALCKRGLADCDEPDSKVAGNNRAIDEGRKASKKTKGKTAKGGELMVTARRMSRESFNRLLKQFDYGSMEKQQYLYRELRARLPRLKGLSRPQRIARLTTKVGGRAMAVAGLGFYTQAVMDVFSSDTASFLEKAAVVTSILPVIGCVVQLADDMEQGRVDQVQTVSCLAQDILLFPVALAMQVVGGVGAWLEAEKKRYNLWDTGHMRMRCVSRWMESIHRVINYLKSDESVANITAHFTAYHIAILYQASQLMGDLHAAQKGLSRDAATAPSPDAPLDISAQVRPELTRQICAEIAESKHHLRAMLQSRALNYAAEFRHQWINHFLDEWFKAATRPSRFLFWTLNLDSPAKKTFLKNEIDKARNLKLPLHEQQIKDAISEAVERVETPAPCKCIHDSEGSKCEFGNCQVLQPRGNTRDAGGRVFTAMVRSIEKDDGLHLSHACQALFKPCQGPGSTGQTGRPLWCKPAHR
ncbi:Diphtheria toxin, translocation domain protein [Metarhizium album ARSEF 1941]|uniref:Diphtheria toxin, translocation domain protein n=1 Tax=Metarhizium album (strain ARSEF 1941) TaxID=1081103 RepID=A0A0B2WV66_METAS|nr:Diphtheria toxin, translocation domain protein [Metarhizium album ARSEF 1941]KHN97968.1 Diphtheria toxin, translocation domain protein [Metarhizium album ARSEF 1941]